MFSLCIKSVLVVFYIQYKSGEITFIGYLVTLMAEDGNRTDKKTDLYPSAFGGG